MSQETPNLRPQLKILQAEGGSQAAKNGKRQMAVIDKHLDEKLNQDQMDPIPKTSQNLVYGNLQIEHIYNGSFKEH